MTNAPPWTAVLAMECVKWWRAHRDDVDSWADGDYTEEANRYDTAPDFVRLAYGVLGLGDPDRDYE